MLWLLFAFLGYLLLAIVFIMDKKIVTKSVSSPAVYTFYTCLFMFLAILAWPFIGFPVLSGIDWFWAVVSGVAYGLALLGLYAAIEAGEASHITPFNGACVTLAVFAFALLFLGERLSTMQILGMVVLVFASVMLSFEKSREHSGFHIGFIWAILSAIFFAVSHVAAKYLYGHYDFANAFVWTRFFMGLTALPLFFVPTVWRSLFHRPRHKKNTSSSISVRHPVLYIISDKLLAIVAVVMIQYAIAIGSVTLVNALSGVQYVLLFVFIFLFSKFRPKVFKEFFTRRELVIQTVAIILVVVGTAFFAF